MSPVPQGGSVAGVFHTKSPSVHSPDRRLLTHLGRDQPRAPTVTRPFCGDCDRERLTADGQVRNCLFAREESDLRAALRGGAEDAEIARRWRDAMWVKRPGHGIDDEGFLQPSRPMSAIGG